MRDLLSSSLVHDGGQHDGPTENASQALTQRLVADHGVELPCDKMIGLYLIR